jgi:exodeoxyribonuclease V
MPFYELTEQMRTSNPALQAVNEQLRETVKTGEFGPIQLVPGSIDHLTDDEMAEALQEYMLDPQHNNRILAYTNARVIQFNDHIRTIRGLPNEWEEGETVINNSAIRHMGEQISVEEELTITHQSSNTFKHAIQGDEETEIEVRRCDVESKIGYPLPNMLIPVDPNHYLALVKHYASVKNWKAMYHLKNNFPDLRQRDAATFHKAQGSSYDVVFIDLGNLSSCRQPDVAARMLYVAFSRARTRVFLHGELAPKFGSIIR